MGNTNVGSLREIDVSVDIGMDGLKRTYRAS